IRLPRSKAGWALRTLGYALRHLGLRIQTRQRRLLAAAGHRTQVEAATAAIHLSACYLNEHRMLPMVATLLMAAVVAEGAPALAMRGAMLGSAGRRRAAVRYFEQARGLALRSDDVVAPVIQTQIEAQYHFCSGRWARARTLLEGALAEARRADLSFQMEAL